MSTIDRRSRECERPGIPMTPMTSGRFTRFFRRKAVAGGLLLGAGVALGLGLRAGLSPPMTGAETAAAETGGTLAVTESAPGRRQEKGAPPEEIAAALAALGGAATRVEVLAATGFDRYALLSRFLASADGAACAALFEELKERGELSHHFSDMILLRWAEVDPAGAVAKGSSAGFWAWAKSDPEAALARALEGGEWDAISVARAVAQDDAAAGEALLRAHPELGQSTVWEGIASSLGETNPRAGAEYALAHGVDLDGVMKRWAETDPEGAQAFALAQTDPRDRGKALEEVLGKIAEDDPSRALAVVAELPTGGMRNGLQEALLKRAAQEDPAMATDWARALPRETERAKALRAIAVEVCQRDPDRALGLFVETLALDMDGDFFGGYGQAEGLGRSLVLTRPAETLTAIAEHGGNESVTTRMTATWVQADPVAASTWIGRQPAGPARDVMVTGLVNGMLQDGQPDFASAAVWALSISPVVPGVGNDRQWSALQSVFSKWLRQDRAAALEAMAHEGLPPQARSFYEMEAARKP